MRDIKFRAWDGEQMVSPDYITRDGCAFWKENSMPTMSKRLMQYTGLKDKKGDEIYEGDIVQSEILYNDDGYGVFLICFYNGIFFAKRHCPDEAEDEYNLDYANEYFGGGFLSDSPALYKLIEEDGLVEIIGNIFQNPELLTAS